MKRGNKNIIKDLIKRKYFLKTELKKIILKSIIQNKNTKPLIRSYAMLKYTTFNKKSFLSKQINVCLIRGRHKGVWSFCQMSRHALNKFATSGFLQNIKIKS
jgi:ribosomal protein S14